MVSPPSLLPFKAFLTAPSEIGFQCRTVEVFQSLGIAHRVVHEGCEVAEVVFYNPDPNENAGKGGLRETQRVVDVSCAVRVVRPS